MTLKRRFRVAAGVARKRKISLLNAISDGDSHQIAAKLLVRLQTIKQTKKNKSYTKYKSRERTGPTQTPRYTREGGHVHSKHPCQPITPAMSPDLIR
jgi:hypothetical protein